MEYIAFTSTLLASALKGRRKALGLRQKDAAARVGLLQKTVSALESSPERCSVDSLQRLMAALELEFVLRPKNEPDAGQTQEW